MLKRERRADLQRGQGREGVLKDKKSSAQEERGSG